MYIEGEIERVEIKMQYERNPELTEIMRDFFASKVLAILDKPEIPPHEFYRVADILPVEGEGVKIGDYYATSDALEVLDDLGYIKRTTGSKPHIKITVEQLESIAEETHCLVLLDHIGKQNVGRITFAVTPDEVEKWDILGRGLYDKEGAFQPRYTFRHVI